MKRDPRNSPDYATLEGYAHDYEKYNVLTDLAEKRITEIARDNSDVWDAAKVDFDLYKFR